MANEIIIGTDAAFHLGYAYNYTKEDIGGETVYTCTKASKWGHPGEVLVLTNMEVNGRLYWIACDSYKDGGILRARQAVFRSTEDVTTPGWHQWETNWKADKHNETGESVEWTDRLWAETRVVVV